MADGRGFVWETDLYEENVWYLSSVIHYRSVSNSDKGTESQNE